MKRWLQDQDNRAVLYSAITCAALLFIHFNWELVP